ACRDYLRLASQDRGINIDGWAYAKLVGTMCDRGSMTGCLVAALIGVRPQDKMPSTSGDAIRSACERGDEEACGIVAFRQLPGGGPERDGRAANARPWGAGRVSAGGGVVDHACEVAERPWFFARRSGREPAPPADDYERTSAAEIRVALKTLHSACDAHDA